MNISTKFWLLGRHFLFLFRVNLFIIDKNLFSFWGKGAIFKIRKSKRNREADVFKGIHTIDMDATLLSR